MRMKLYLIALLLAAGSLSGCSKDEAAGNSEIGGIEITQTFFTEDPVLPRGAQPASRTVVNDDGTISFAATEKMSAHIWAVVDGVVNQSTDGKTATRKAGTPPTVSTPYITVSGATEYNFVFVSPAGNGKIADVNTYEALNIHLSEAQTPTAASFDTQQDVLISKRVAATPEATPTSLPTVQFKRLFTFFRMSVDRSIVTQIPASDKIMSVSIEALDPAVVLTGDATVPVTDDPAACVPTFTAPSNRVTADYGTGADFTADKFDVWMVVNPATFTGMRIKIRTTTKLITQTLDAFECDLRANTINTMSFRFVNKAGITSTVADSEDYFQSGVVVDGVRYDSTTAGAKTVEGGATISPASGGVLFLNASAQTPAKAPGITSDLVIIGRYSDERPSLPMQTYWALRNSAGKLVFKNLDLDFTAVTTNYCFNLTSGGSDAGGMGTLCFEDCDIRFNKTMVTLYNAAVTAGIEHIVFRNCKLRYEGNANTSFITTSKTDEGLDVFKTFVFENNLFYAPDNGAAAASALNFGLLYQENQTAATGSLANLAITCTGNTFINITGFGSGKSAAYFSVVRIGSVLFSQNLLYSERSDKYPSIVAVYYDYDTNGPWPSIDLQKERNMAFNTLGWKLFNTAAGMYYNLNTTYAKNSGTPFTTYDTAAGRFVKDPAYADYGSTRE